MTRNLRVHLLPSLFEPEELRGGVAVVIDLLRASTTIVHALAAGATCVVPCLEVNEARAVAAAHPSGTVLLGGERGGELIPGFDLDNSPLSYTTDRVAGRTVAFTTTNGTRALLRCGAAERVFVGALANLSAVVDVLAGDLRPVHLVCAGTRGQIGADDCLCAGAIAAKLADPSHATVSLDDSARMAADYFRAHRRDEALLGALRDSLGGRDLLALGVDADVARAAERDLFSVVPEFFPVLREIRVADR